MLSAVSPEKKSDYSTLTFISYFIDGLNTKIQSLEKNDGKSSFWACSQNRCRTFILIFIVK